MRRRRFIGAVTGGALTLLGGCLAQDETQPRDSGTPTDETPTPTPSPGETFDVSVESLQLQYGIVTPHSPDSIGIDNSETAYIVAAITTDSAVTRSDFTLRTGERTYAPTIPDNFYRTDWGDEDWYRKNRTDGLLLFEIDASAADPDQPVAGLLQLAWPGGSVDLESSFIGRINESAPQLTVTVDVPDPYDGTEAPPLTITVANDAEIDRRFLGAVNRTGPRVAFTPVTTVSEMVPAGETVRLTIDDSWSGMPPEERIGDGDPDVTYYLHHGDTDTSADIRLVE